VAVPAPKSSGVASVDALAKNPTITLHDYIEASADYILAASGLSDSQKKAAQIRLSNGLGSALLNDLRVRLGPKSLASAVAGETDVGGGLRTAKSDVTEFDRIDGVRLAVELKPVHLAIGRAVWNRLGDVRVFAVNLHLKFPFAVVAGVLSVPTEERAISGYDTTWKSTVHIIEKLSGRLARAASRDLDSDPPHLLEAATVIVFDPRTKRLHPTLPEPGLGIRWDECVDRLAEIYQLRFE
jgi:hypothetical protein